jgi:hypothetical protein
MPASRSVVSAVLQERFGHPDRAASVREHGRQARELHKLALRELHGWLGRRRPARVSSCNGPVRAAHPEGLILAG